MKLLISLLVIIALAAQGIGTVVYIDAGYVLLSWDVYTYESSLWIFLILLAVALLALYIAVRAILVLFGSDWKFNEWRAKRRSLRARLQTTRGLLALAQGQWRRAERNLTASAPDADQPLINYLAAARAAYEQGKEEATDEWLKAASHSTKGSDLAVGITQVQLLQSRHANEQALAVLMNLREKNPKHAYLLKLMVKTLQDLEDWVALNDLLPTLRNEIAYETDRIRDAEFPGYSCIAETATVDRNAAELATFLTISGEAAREIAGSRNLFAD